MISPVAWWLLVGCEAPPPSAVVDEAPPRGLHDFDPDPAVFHGAIVARATDTLVGGEPVRAWTYDGTLPGPEIRVRAGDRVVVDLTNELPDGQPTTIHWHGIEGTNAADGTPTTQAPVQAGEWFRYDFVVPRPGVYWYHPHIRGATSVHSGLYGALVVDDPDQPELVAMGVLPGRREVLVLSDMGVHEGAPIRVESDDDLVLMNGSEGEHLLVDGKVRPVYEVAEGEGLRLQLVNTSIARYWRLRVPGRELVRVGGQGGLLTRARVEGGMVATDLGEVHLGYERGEILLAPGERADVVLSTVGEVGDELVLRWEDFARGRHGMTLVGDEMVMGDAADDGSRPGVDVATFRLVEGSGVTYGLSDGDAVLAAVGRGQEPVSGAVPTFVGEDAVVLSERMEMIREPDGGWTHEADFLLDGVAWTMEGHDAHEDMALAPTARFARLGEVQGWEVRNDTGMAHPFHLHGFSFRPTSVVWHGDADHGEPAGGRWELPWVEWVDTVHVPAHGSVFFDVELADPLGGGLAAGRWMMHCHLLQHAEAGMMSELVVSP